LRVNENVGYLQTLVGFVNFKLYHDLGLQYPPILDHRLEKAAAGIICLFFCWLLTPCWFSDKFALYNGWLCFFQTGVHN
jgi:hypothetical protein